MHALTILQRCVAPSLCPCRCQLLSIASLARRINGTGSGMLRRTVPVASLRETEPTASA
jgi:hypothetical protein